MIGRIEKALRRQVSKRNRHPSWRRRSRRHGSARSTCAARGARGDRLRERAARARADLPGRRRRVRLPRESRRAATSGTAPGTARRDADGVLYFGEAAFWSAKASAGGDPTADLQRAGPQLVGRFDLAGERWLPPLEVGEPGEPLGRLGRARRRRRRGLLHHLLRRGRLGVARDRARAAARARRRAERARARARRNRARHALRHGHGGRRERRRDRVRPRGPHRAALVARGAAGLSRGAEDAALGWAAPRALGDRGSAARDRRGRRGDATAPRGDRDRRETAARACSPSRRS